MNVTEKYESSNDHAVARFQGVVNLHGAVQLVSAAIERARAENTRRLLVNVAGLDGFPSPTLADRYFFVRQWAKVAEGRVKLAMVAKQHMIDPDYFGIKVAHNAGLEAFVSSGESESLEWLLSGICDEL